MAYSKFMTVLRRMAVACIAAIGVALILFSTPSVVFAQPPQMSANEAHSATLNGELIILDIRSPGEWAETGVAKGAWPVTMHDPNFSANLQRIIDKYPNRPLALICATGGGAIMSPRSLSKTAFQGRCCMDRLTSDTDVFCFTQEAVDAVQVQYRSS